MFTPVILAISGLSLVKNYLDFNHVIWRLYGFVLSWHQILKFKVLLPPAIWANFGLPLPYRRFCTVKNHEGSKPKNIQIIELESKQNFYIR